MTSRFFRFLSKRGPKSSKNQQQLPENNTIILNKNSQHQFEMGGQKVDWIGPYAIFFQGRKLSGGTY